MQAITSLKLYSFQLNSIFSWLTVGTRATGCVDDASTRDISEVGILSDPNLDTSLHAQYLINRI